MAAGIFLMTFCLLCSSFYVLNARRGPSRSSNHSAQYEQHASDILNAAALRQQRIWNRKRDMFLSVAKVSGYNVIDQSLVMQRIERDYHDLAYDLATNLSTIPIVELKNQTLRRQVKRLSKLQLRGLDDAEYEQVKQKLYMMSTFLSINLPHPKHVDKVIPMVPNMLKEIVALRKREPLYFYWDEWRRLIRNNARKTFLSFVKLFRKAAALNGHVTPSRTWYLYYEVENFQDELESIVFDIMPLYKELHTYLRHIARSAYESRYIDSDGAIPAPIIEQMIHGAWYTPTILKTPYKDYKLPNIMRRLWEIMNSTVEINKAKEYLESLGLNRISRSFSEKFSRRMSTDEDGDDCKSEVYYFPPDVGLRFCTHLDYKKLMQMHGHMTEIQYNLYRKDLPFGLDREPYPGFGAAIAESVVLASGSPHSLGRLNILANQSLSEQNTMNRLFRMAVHTVLAIPQYFINDKYFVDVLDGRIDEKELNCAYWKLQYKYAGVMPPSRRSEINFDPDYKFYRGLHPEKSSTSKFLTEVLGLQFYRAFCLAGGNYRPGDTRYPLNNCDFYNSTEAGDLMKKMMKLGSKRPFHEILEVIGDKKLSSAGILEYFAPLFNWLKENNKKLGLDVGWSSDIKCESP